MCSTLQENSIVSIKALSMHNSKILIRDIQYEQNNVKQCKCWLFMYGTRSLHTFQSFQKSQILCFLFPKLFKRASTKVEKVIERSFSKIILIAMSQSCRVQPSSKGPTLHHSGGKCLSRKGFPYFLFTKCCHIERGRNLYPNWQCPIYSPSHSGPSSSGWLAT